MLKPIVSYQPFYPRTDKAKRLPFLFRHWNRLLSEVDTPLAGEHWIGHPYDYGERSNIGWLALAAQRAGCISIQEPSVRRTKGGGRSDLWILQKPRMYMYDFEAKQCPLYLTNPKNKRARAFPVSIKTLLEDAVEQVENKDPDYQGHTSVGVVFLQLYARKGIEKQELVGAVNIFKREMIDKYMKEAGADFLALHLAPYAYIDRVARKYNCEPSPGIAILGKVAWSVS